MPRAMARNGSARDGAARSVAWPLPTPTSHPGPRLRRGVAPSRGRVGGSASAGREPRIVEITRSNVRTLLYFAASNGIADTVAAELHAGLPLAVIDWVDAAKGRSALWSAAFYGERCARPAVQEAERAWGSGRGPGRGRGRAGMMLRARVRGAMSSPSPAARALSSSALSSSALTSSALTSSALTSSASERRSGQGCCPRLAHPASARSAPALHPRLAPPPWSSPPARLTSSPRAVAVARMCGRWDFARAASASGYSFTLALSSTSRMPRASRRCGWRRSAVTMCASAPSWRRTPTSRGPMGAAWSR